MNALTETHNALTAQRSRVRLYYLLYIFLYAVALVFVILKQLPVASIIAGGNAVLYFVFVRGQVKGYSSAVARASTLHGLCASLTDPQSTGSKGMTSADFRRLELLPIRDTADSLLAREGFSGKGFGLQLQGWEVTFHYPVEVKGHTSYKFLNGTLLTAELPQAASEQADWLLVRKGVLDPDAQQTFVRQNGFVPITCPVEALTQQFDLYGKAAEEMPGSWADRILRLAEKAGSLNALRVSPRQAAAFLGNRFYTVRTRLADLPTAEQLRICLLAERDPVWELFRFWGTAGKR